MPLKYTVYLVLVYWSQVTPSAYPMSLVQQEYNSYIRRIFSVVYKGTLLDCAYKADFIVENNLIIELKSIEQFMRVHEAQLLTYMRHAKVSVGLLINFNVTLLKLGLKRYVL